MKYFLGLDCGGTFIKAILIDTEGKIVGIEKNNISTISNNAGYAERNMNEFWDACSNLIKNIINNFNIDTRLILGIGISAQGKGTYLLDKDFNPLGNAILSSDQRANNIVNKWKKKGLDKLVYPFTKQNIWSGHPVSILKWIKDNDRDRYDKIEYILMTHDYLRFCLTGSLFCEVTNISESNLYNINTNEYDKYLSELFDIPEIFSKLSPIIKSNEVSGYITEYASEKTGLAVGIPVIAGLFDIVSAAFCCHLENEKVLSGILGTWNIISGVSESIKHSNSGLSQGAYIENKVIIHDDSPTSMANLEWFRKMYGDIDYEEINKMIESLPICSSNIIFIPFLYGSNYKNNIQGGIYGIQFNHSKEHLFQAIYEGVFFSFKYHLERMKEIFKNVNTLRISGGVTYSKVGLKMLADITGMKIEVLNIDEIGCYGIAIFTMKSLGFDINNIIKNIENKKVTIHPNYNNNKIYKNKYKSYLRTLEQLSYI
ncbi:FGGY-family carbohydrate kinase [Avibacterium sp. 21-599]|uniref:FGGY-family carbohydrate kinase n=1 Tax=Avibacterium sp. 21-599 TaxID=2911528 RepID=UPI002247CE9E|nr:FGGY-family carbohydrate kinase [Avibacterium sp. 21-599]MCW9717196.1 carbohydrate kinase [Avibacterium sp. 21-599]